MIQSHISQPIGGRVRLIGGNIYANADKHCGALLANMCKRGMLVRVRPGVFKLLDERRA